MASKATIIAAIDARVSATNTKYSSWRIGITHDLAERKKYWGETKNKNVGCWTSWEADSLSDARAIESHFIAKGMDGGEGGDMSPYRTAYVYIF
jgi:hypothetical protein